MNVGQKFGGGNQRAQAAGATGVGARPGGWREELHEMCALGGRGRRPRSVRSPGRNHAGSVREEYTIKDAAWAS